MWKESGYFGIDKTASNLGISRTKAKALLKKESTYQRTTYPKHRDKKFEKIMAEPKREGRPDQFQGDLLDVAQLKQKNGGVRFLCVYLDVYSRKAWVFGLKKKTSSELMRVNKPFLTKYRPYNITWDKEAAIRGRELTALLKKLDIRRWEPDKDQPDEFKGATAIVERFNRTLRTWITRYTVDNNKRYIDALPDWVRTYNNTVHRTIKRTPQSVWQQNDFVHKPRHVEKLPVGTKVRVKLTRSLFEKKTKPAWSDAVYKVQGHTGKKYHLESKTGKRYKARLPRQDILPVPEDSEVYQEPSPRKRTRTFTLDVLTKPRRSARAKRVDYSGFY